MAAALSAALVLIANPRPVPALIMSLGLAVPIVALSYPPWYEGHARGLKDILRIGAGVVLGSLLALLTASIWWASLLSLLALYGVFRQYKQLRLQVGDHGCEGCPELGKEAVCSGYSRQAEAFRAYRARVEEELNRPGRFPLPQCRAQRPR
jgi:hypothetical protein